jgi:hypothetical protein
MMFDRSFLETVPDERLFDPRGLSSPLAEERPGQRRGPTGMTASRGVYDPILRASQAGGLCALMDELRRLGALGPGHRGGVGEVSA